MSHCPDCERSHLPNECESCDTLKAENRRLKREVVRLKKALRPYADEYGTYGATARKALTPAPRAVPKAKPQRCECTAMTAQGRLACSRHIGHLGGCRYDTKPPKRAGRGGGR